MEYQYKKTKTLLERQNEAKEIIEKYPQRIPVICERDPSSTLEDIQKKKYLVPYDMTVSQFSFIIRQKLRLTKEAALFLLVNGKVSIVGNQTISEAYQTHKDIDDSFLYITYTSQLTWG